MEKPNKTLIIATLWVATAGLAYWSGRTLPQRPDKVGRATAVPASSAPEFSRDAKAPLLSPSKKLELLSPEGFEATPTAVSNSQRLVRSRSSRNTVDPMVSLRKALNSDDPISQMENMAATLRNLNSSNVEQVVALMESGSDDRETRRQLGIVLKTWATFDGPGAMDYVSEMPRDSRFRFGVGVIESWAKKDISSAETWARENFDGEDNPYIIGLVSAASKSNQLDQATDLTYSLPYGRNRGRAVGRLVDGYMETGVNNTLKWAEELPEGVLREGILSRVAGRVAEEDPLASANWILGMQEGEALERSMASIADSWSERDPSAAVKWLGQIDDPAIRSDSLAVATRNWASDDPEAAGEWIRSIEPSPEMDRPVTSYAKTIFNKNPQEAMIYASRVSDDKRRNKLLEGLAQHWMKRDPEGAEAFLSP